LIDPCQQDLFPGIGYSFDLLIRLYNGFCG